MSRTYKRDCLFDNSYKAYTTKSKRKNRNRYGRSGKFWRQYRNSQLRTSYNEYISNIKSREDYSDKYSAPIMKKTLMWDIW